MAFAIENEQAELVRLRRAGIASASLMRMERVIDDADPTGLRASFALVQVPDQPEGRINLVRHLTPEAMWQERFLRHANNAASLGELVIAVEDPAAAAARFSRLVGCPVQPDRSGGFALELRHGNVRLLPGTAELPRIIGLSIETSDRNDAVSGLLTERGIAHAREGETVVVDPDAAGGVALCFRPTG
jgi:hypothetical protein